MAEDMQDIKRRIKSISSTERITNAMKLVSASKLRKAKKTFESSKNYLTRLIQTIDETFAEAEEGLPKEFIAGSRDIKTTCYVVITSSNGLCGSFNANVIKAMEANIRDAGDETKIVTIGTKARDYFSRRGYDILMTHDAPADTVTFEETKAISEPLINLYLRGEIDEIRLVSTSYVNTLQQEVITRPLLPLQIGEKFEQTEKKDEGIKHIIEYGPSAKDVFEYLVPKYVELMIFSTAIESATCEYAARRTAMENANDNASDMLSALQIHYNRARQTEITNEIIEIVAGSQAQQ